MTPIYDNIENELLREQLLATSAESPAEAFVKRLLNPSPASRSKFEELLRAATAEASLAATATQAKESALENEDLHELAASEAAVAALHASSSFEVPTTKGAVQHRRLEGEIDAASEVFDAKGVAQPRRLQFWCELHWYCNLKEDDNCNFYVKIYDECFLIECGQLFGCPEPTAYV